MTYERKLITMFVREEFEEASRKFAERSNSDDWIRLERAMKALQAVRQQSVYNDDACKMLWETVPVMRWVAALNNTVEVHLKEIIK